MIVASCGAVVVLIALFFAAIVVVAAFITIFTMHDSPRS